MCTLAFSTRAVVDNVLGGDATRLRSLSARFSRMVFHGDTLTTRIGRDPADATALWFDTLNQGGERVLEHGRVTYAA
jgi:acyl dehydratase